MFRRRTDAPNGMSSLLWPNPATGPWLLKLEWVTVRQRPECIGVELRSFRKTGEAWPPELPTWRESCPALTSDVWRALPIATIVRDLRLEMASSSVVTLSQMIDSGEWSGDDKRDLRRLRTAAAVPLAANSALPASLHEEVAQVYEAAWKDGRSPTQTVADHFQISHSAAAKRVHRARAAGALPTTTKGRPGMGTEGSHLVREDVGEIEPQTPKPTRRGKK